MGNIWLWILGVINIIADTLPLDVFNLFGILNPLNVIANLILFLN